MRGLKVMLLGVSVVLFSGFFVVGQALGSVSESIFSWGLFVGLLLSFLGLLMDERRGHGDRSAGTGPGESKSEDGGDAAESGDDTEEDGDGTFDDRDHYSANRFPPM